ncbi:P-loop containing nucleoside triphosphate hydrolase protein [Gloeopeniophorella convolvens]|nr:P-loop containing nucleoside triphosphate hydrolase protein [Gloeopeniophorella convolvens]
MALSTFSRAARLPHRGILSVSCRGLTALSARRHDVPSISTNKRYEHALAIKEGRRLEILDASASQSDEELEPQVTPSEPAFTVLRTKASSETLRAITDHPFSHSRMSSVQAAVLPLLPELARPYDKTDKGGPPRDLLVKAKTGTGKTLAFLVPAIEARLKAIDAAGQKALENNGGVPDARVVEGAKRSYAKSTVGTVIISPTRELATQISQEAIKLTHWHKGFEVKLFTGGSSKTWQLRDFRRGRSDIVVATPGRIRDVLENDPEVAQVLKSANLLVLDEADTLLDMGFRPDIDAITEFFPKTPVRQTFMFSATISSAIRQIAHEVLDSDHHFIDVVPKDSSPVHAHIPQNYTVVPQADQQIPHLVRLIAHDQLVNPGKSKVIVFLNTTKQTQLFTTLIREMFRTVLPGRPGPRIFEIHSKRTQSARTAASNQFRKDESGILVTSDVSARGVDYPGVTRVIQVGSPTSTAQYIHRVGRTGRAGKGGRADLILLPFEKNFVKYQLPEVPIKEVLHDKVAGEVTTLAGLVEEDIASYSLKVKEINPRAQPPRSPERLFRDKPAAALADLEKQISSLVDNLDTQAIDEVFVSLLGFYFSKSSDMHVTRRSIYQALQTWTMEACKLPQAPHVSQSLLAKMGGLDGGERAPSAQRGGLRRSFGLKEPSTQYGGGQRNRTRNETTDRKYGRERSFDAKRGPAPSWMGRGSTGGKERRRTEGHESREDSGDDFFSARRRRY